MSEADRTQAELAAITAGYSVGPVGDPPVALITPELEARFREIVREEMERSRTVTLPAPPTYGSQS